MLSYATSSACSAEPSLLEDTYAMHSIIRIFKYMYVYTSLWKDLFVYLLFFYLSILPFVRALPDDFHTALLILIVLFAYGTLHLSLVLINVTKGKSYLKHSTYIISF